eukprot:1014853-Amphidinium_carterae.1
MKERFRSSKFTTETLLPPCLRVLALVILFWRVRPGDMHLTHRRVVTLRTSTWGGERTLGAQSHRDWKHNDDYAGIAVAASDA